jgi:ribonuclease-3
MTGTATSDLAEMVASIGHDFAEPGLLRAALTHPSSLARPGARRRPAGAYDADNQRLEFLGDRVLGLVVAEMLYETFPGEDEGALAMRLAALVRQEGLAQVALALDLGRHLVLSKGEADGGGRENPASLADACEAVIGAIFLDGGLEAARKFIDHMWRPMLLAEAKPPQDAKTALQEWAQAHGFPLPVYEVVSASGPPHEPTFVVRVSVSGRAPVDATGRSKRTAEQAAARALFANLGT